MPDETGLLPHVPFYLDGEPHVDPELMVAHYVKSRGVSREQLGVRPVVLGTWRRGVSHRGCGFLLHDSAVRRDVIRL